MAEGVVATFRPSAGDVFIAVQKGGTAAYLTMALDEARQIHGTLGQALRLADCTADPVAAIPDGPSWALRRTVAAAVRGDCTDAFSGVSRFARRIEAGEADDSEPMRVACSVAFLFNSKGQA